MTPEEAIACMRARWAHAPLDPLDVYERIAIRFEHHAAWPPFYVMPRSPACRLFIAHAGGWLSCYVHSMYDVDEAIDWMKKALP
jgi:hypothetical protein